MKTSSIIRGRWLITVLGMACSSDPTGPDLGVEPAGDPTVEEVIPNSGFRGTTLDIRVIGSGYDDGTEVSFEEEGNPTDGIVTNSTEFVSEGELVANITIAEDAEPGAYDVVVLTTVRKRGIGLEAFIVSTVVVGTLPGGVHSTATDVNDNGEVVGFVQIGFPGEPGFDGQHATYWFGGTLEDLSRGQAFGISEDCAVGSCRVVGFRERAPVVWQKEEGTWTSVVLPTESGSGLARAINDRGAHDALAAEACDYVMPDLMRIGGVSGWLRAAPVAAAAGIQVSTHLYPEVAAHLMRVTETAHWLEWQDWADPILKEPFVVKNSCLEIPDLPGTGIEWDEAAVARYRY